GLDVLDLVPSGFLSNNEIAAAELVHWDYFNTQDQPHIVWPASFLVAGAYVDQLARSNGLAPERVAAVRQALDRAQKLSGAERRCAAPTPEMAPVIVWVVLTGIPKCEAMNSVMAPLVSAQKPPNGVSLVRRWPMVLTIRQPPVTVPNPIAAPHATTTQAGTVLGSVRCRGDAASAPVP